MFKLFKIFKFFKFFKFLRFFKMLKFKDGGKKKGKKFWELVLFIIFNLDLFEVYIKEVLIKMELFKKGKVIKSVLSVFNKDVVYMQNDVERLEI